MKYPIIIILLSISLVFSGCGSVIDGEYFWEQPHSIPTVPESEQTISAGNYSQLYMAIAQCVESGNSALNISVVSYDRDMLEPDVARAIEKLIAENPVASYAVENITYEIGISGGKTVLALEVKYRHNQSEIKNINVLPDISAATDAVIEALNTCESGIVLRISNYTDADFIQLVEDYATEHPEIVMETPQLSVSVFPQSGKDRVVEIRFLYQTSRDTLRNMQSQVTKLFDAAVDMVSVTVQDRGKYTQMYALLMELFQNNYSVETSITPAYSLFLYGVGDVKTFATVYSAMCRKAGLECLNVVGTRNGEVWYWNIVCIDGVYYHVDLLRSKDEGQFREMSDSEMIGYVWDFSAYPKCNEESSQ